MKTEKKIKIFTNVGLGLCFAGLILLFVGMVFDKSMISDPIKYTLAGVGAGIFIIGVVINFVIPRAIQKNFNKFVLEKGVRTAAAVSKVEVISSGKKEKEYKLTFSVLDGDEILDVVSYKVVANEEKVPHERDRWEISYNREEKCAVMLDELEPLPEDAAAEEKAKKDAVLSAGKKPNLGAIAGNKKRK